MNSHDLKKLIESRQRKALVRVQHLQIKKHIIEMDFEEAILEARKEGCTLREIAEVAGISNPTVLSIERRFKEDG